MKLSRRLRGGSADAERQNRVPGRWWWVRIVTGVALLIWRTILVALTWHH